VLGQVAPEVGNAALDVLALDVAGFLVSASALSAAVYAASRPALTSRSFPTTPTTAAVWPEVASIPLRKRRFPV
jgi:hypothetical protein